MTIVLMALAGGLGAGTRFVADGLVRSLARTALPLGTILVNVTGSLLLGVLAGLVSAGAPTQLQLVLGTGFLGGYTTFSTASVETIRLIQGRRIVLALANSIGTILATLAAAAVGVLLGGWLSGS